MQMEDRSQQFEAIFDAAVAISDREQREVFVREKCSDDHNLAAEIIGMLGAHEQVGGFLETVANRGSGPFVELKEGTGTKIGRYKLLQKIGEGGYGVVYMAEQEEPVRRRVALKIIKLGMDTREVMARFEAERQALVMMDHPNIAKVFDAGSTESGRPYFVMELVRGVAITKFSDQENLSARERLKLFIDVCKAIQHAHLNGIIHRDIKPSNVMVTLHDGKPVPKVIDFGIAKATQQRLTEKTLFTQYQQFIGTPAYMSPEQAEMSGLDVDTRTDVYALGVMLYELLVGKTPFDSAELASAGYDEIRRRIREEEPSKPSTRLATLAADDLTSIARHRRCEPGSLSKVVRGDLDWIVMTAMDKDRQRRYESPGLLAKDIDRYLRDQAVEARPPSVSYRIQKFVRRHRFACAAGGITVASLVAGLFFSIYGLTQARRGWDEAEVNLQASKEAERQATLQKERADAEAAAVQRMLYPSMLAAANDAVRDGRRKRAVELLAMCPDSARSWEWAWVSRSLADPVQSFKGHQADQCVYDVRFDTNGTRLVTAGEDGAVHVWNTETASKVATFNGHDGPVLLSTFSKDQQHVTSIGSDHTLRGSNVLNGDEIGHSVGIEGEFTGAAITDNGERIVTSERNGKVRLWSLGLESELAVMDDRVADVVRLAATSDGSKVAAVAQSGRLLLWNSDGTRIREIREDGLGFESLQFSPAGNLIATGDEEGQINIWSTRDGTRLQSWNGHTRSASALAFNQDGSLLATAGWEGGIAVRDVRSAEEVGFLLTDETHIHAIAFAPDGGSIAVAGESGSLTRWSLDQLLPTMTFVGHEDLVFEVVATPDGSYLASAGKDGTLRLWDSKSGVEIRRLRWRAGSVYSVDVNANGTRMATRGSGGVIRIWELPSGRLVREQTVDYRVRNLRFSPDGSRLAAGALRNGARPETKDPAISIWDVETGEELIRLEGHRGQVMRMDFHPDGTRLVTTSQRGDSAPDGRALVWDLTSGEAMMELQPEGDAVSNSVLWSSDGSRIYTGHSDGRVCFWDASSGRLQRTVFAHGEMVGAIEMSRDRKRLLTCAWYSSEVKLWHADTGELQLSIDTGIPGISDVGFDVDDRAIIVAGMDGGLKRVSADILNTGGFQRRRETQQLASDVLDLEGSMMADDLKGDPFHASVERLLETHRSLHNRSSQGSVTTQSSHQVAAAALDQIVQRCFQTRRFDEAL
ncbi:MAG: WD40 repeat protein/serine/threonine protein kinase [Verrucomicrobiales bacterium]|jgi:WD40 repeat protein/serine/threonine protein kinase